MSATFNRLHNVINDALGMDKPLDIYPGTRLGDISTEELEWMTVLVELEIAFHISIDDREFDLLVTVADLVGLIDAKLTAREAA